MKRPAVVFLAALSSAFGQSGGRRIEAPRFWNDRGLSDWATPVAGLNVRPGHFSEKEYDSAPIGELVRTYPVYFPGREPTGYWDMLRKAKPEPLITTGARTTADWAKQGKRVFHEMDIRRHSEHSADNRRWAIMIHQPWTRSECAHNSIEFWRAPPLRTRSAPAVSCALS